MDLRLTTVNEVSRDYSRRLERAAAARTAAEIRHRMRVRNRLRKAILEVVKLRGETPDVACELKRLIRGAECRLGERPCI